MTGITKLPWRAIRRSGYLFRRLVATKDKPKELHLLVDSPVDKLEDELRMEHFREGWILSYHYKGEDSNLCRAEFKHGAYSDLQLHIRLFDRDDDRTELYAHIELDPMSHPRLHIKGQMLHTGKGIQMAQGILDQKGIVYEKVEPDTESEE